MKLGIFSDLHSGHYAGLTGPTWQLDNREGDSPSVRANNKRAAIQRACWDFYESQIRILGPFDVVLANGDLIDGRNEKSGGTELLSSDRNVQCEMAEYALRKAISSQTKQVIITHGTRYHAGSEEDWEGRIAENLGAKIGDHEWFTMEGVTFDARHHVGSSNVPYGRHTPVARAAVWAKLWEAEGLIPKWNVMIRSHVHYFSACQDKSTLRLTTPALQGFGSKYGARVCEGLVDFGFVVFDCHDGKFTWQVVTATPPEFRATALVIQ